MIRKVVHIILFIVAVLQVNAQKTKLSFTNKSYIGDTLYLLKESDLITQKTDTIALAKVDKDGQWNFTFNPITDAFYKMTLYRNEVWIYSTPEKQYNFKVPNKQVLTIEDSLNSYFEPVTFYAELLNRDSSEVQNAVTKLDYSIDTLMQKHFKSIHFKIRRRTVDSLLQILEKKFDYVKAPFFKNYLFYKIVLIRYMSYERDANYIIKYYFNDKPVLLNNPAYSELFNQIFNDYLSYYATKAWGENVYSAIVKAKSPAELRACLKRNPAFTNDTLTDLVILKGIHDAYYTNEMPNKIKFPASALRMVLDSMMIVAKTKELKAIATKIKSKINKEEVVFTFEDYPFYDLEGNQIYLRNYTGRYMYVTISDGRSYDFIINMKSEKACFSRFNDKLRLVNIVLNVSKEKMQKLIKENELMGNFFLCDKPELFKKQLKLRALPVFLIFKPDGQILNSNASLPDERIIPYFMELIKE